jgi:hypothetical protein
MKSPRVFISYSRQDLRFARCMVCAIKEAGGNPWLDLEQIKPGQQWPDETLIQLRNSDYVILILSQQSVHGKGFVRKEFIEAIEEAGRRKSDFIFTFKTDDCEIPKALQHINCVSNRNNGINQIIAAMKLPVVRKSRCKCQSMTIAVVMMLFILTASVAAIAYWYSTKKI